MPAQRQECLRIGAGDQGLRGQLRPEPRTAPRGGRDRDAPPVRRAAASARSRASRRSARHGPGSRRPAAPSARRCWRVPRQRRSSASASTMSARWAPIAADARRGVATARPAARLSRSQSSTASAGAPSRRSAIGQARVMRAAGKRRQRRRHARSSARPGPAAPRWPRPRAAPWRPPARPARTRSDVPSASRRLRCAVAASCAATSRAWPGSSAQTSRSRKRRRPDVPSWNSRSICGVSQTAATRAAISAWLRGAAPSRRNTRRFPDLADG